MLSVTLRRLFATLPALALCALVAGVAAALSDAGWAVVLGDLAAAVPVTLALTLPALALGSVLGALFGLTASLRRRSMAGALGALLGACGAALPGVLTVAVVAPLAVGATGGGAVALAWAALSLPAAAAAARRTRDALDHALEAGPVLAAHGRGLSEGTVLRHHAVPLGLAPAAEGLRLAGAATVAGAMVAEALFGPRGAGALLVDAVHGHAAATAVAALAGLSAVALLLNALGAVAHGLLDPRARLG